MRLTKTARMFVLCLVVAAAGYGLVRAGFAQNLGTWAALLLCPLMHVVMMVFMGKGHGGHTSGDGAEHPKSHCEGEQTDSV